MHIITDIGAYRTIDGRKVTISRFSTIGPEKLAIATDLNFITMSGERGNLGQRYYLDGRVKSERPGEENDRIVAKWGVPLMPAAPTVVPFPGYYRTRDGQKVQVTRIYEGVASFGLNGHVKYVFNESGKANYGSETSHDIVGPWVEPVAESPVQEVTERRIVPGVYGIVTVGRRLDSDKPSVAVTFGRDQTAAQLRDAARILTELADFLDA